MHAARTAARKTPRYPSAANRVQRVAAPKRVPADRYTPLSYGHAVAKGVVRANREYRRHDVPPGEHGPALPSVPHWHPNQLRHAHATAVRRRYGLEAAGATLGHAKLSATEVYAERDLGLAVRVAEETG
jgi:integrase